MRARIIISSGWFYVALGAAAVPIALIIMFLAAGNTSVAWELAILLAVFAAVMILGAYTAVTSGELGPHARGGSSRKHGKGRYFGHRVDRRSTANASGAGHHEGVEGHGRVRLWIHAWQRVGDRCQRPPLPSTMCRCGQSIQFAARRSLE